MIDFRAETESIPNIAPAARMTTDFPTAPLALRYTEWVAAPWKSLSLRLAHQYATTPAATPTRLRSRLRTRPDRLILSAPNMR